MSKLNYTKAVIWKKDNICWWEHFKLPPQCCQKCDTHVLSYYCQYNGNAVADKVFISIGECIGCISWISLLSVLLSTPISTWYSHRKSIMWKFWSPESYHRWRHDRSEMTEDVWSIFWTVVSWLPSSVKKKKPPIWIRMHDTNKNFKNKIKSKKPLIWIRMHDTNSKIRTLIK